MVEAVKKYERGRYKYETNNGEKWETKGQRWEAAKSNIKKTCKNDNSIQKYHTPYNLCIQAVQYLFDNSSTINENTTFGVVYNLEFVMTLLEFGIKPENITFISDSSHRNGYIKWYGIKTVYFEKGEDLMSEKMKFGVVVANPPYKGEFHLQMYVKFVIMSQNLTLCVNPGAWLFTERPTQSAWRAKKEVEDYKKNFIFCNGNAHFDASLWMPCVISLINKKEEDKKALVYTEYDRTEYVYEDISKINKFGNIPEYYSVRDKILGLTKTDSVWKHSKDEGEESVPMATIRGHIKETINQMFDRDFYTFLPDGVKGSESVEKVHNFKFHSKIEAANFAKFLKTKIARFALSIMKNGGNISRKQLETVPWLDFSQEWTDEILREKFNITDDEWKFIDKAILNYH